MSRWTAVPAYRNQSTKLYEVWTATLNYRCDNKAIWYNKIELHANTKEAVELIQSEVLAAMQANEILGVTYG